MKIIILSLSTHAAVTDTGINEFLYPCDLQCRTLSWYREFIPWDVSVACSQTHRRRAACCFRPMIFHAVWISRNWFWSLTAQTSRQSGLSHCPHGCSRLMRYRYKHPPMTPFLKNLIGSYDQGWVYPTPRATSPSLTSTEVKKSHFSGREMAAVLCSSTFPLH